MSSKRTNITVEVALELKNYLNKMIIYNIKINVITTLSKMFC